MSVNAAAEPRLIDLESAPSERRRINAQIVIGVILILLLGVSALAAPWTAPYPPDAQQLILRLQPPSAAHLLGTDAFGRDILSRLLWGGRISMAVGLLSMAIAVVAGFLVGASSGFFGGIVDAVLMRFTELVMIFPTYFLIILVVSSFGRGIPLLIAVIGLTSWPISARIIRGEVLKIKERDFVLASRAVGAPSWSIIGRHILPNIVSVIVVSATVRVGINILVEAGLSFLGLGVQPPLASWGNMVSEGAGVLREAWWLTAIPAMAIFLTVLGFNFLGEGLRDLIDPRGGKDAAG